MIDEVYQETISTSANSSINELTHSIIEYPNNNPHLTHEETINYLGEVSITPKNDVPTQPRTGQRSRVNQIPRCKHVLKSKTTKRMINCQRLSMFGSSYCATHQVRSE